MRTDRMMAAAGVGRKFPVSPVTVARSAGLITGYGRASSLVCCTPNGKAKRSKGEVQRPSRKRSHQGLLPFQGALQGCILDSASP